MVFLIKKLDSLNLRRLALTTAAAFGVLILFAILTLVLEFFIDREIDARLQRVVTNLPPGVEVHYGRVRTSLWTETISLREVSLKTDALPEPLLIKSLSVGRIDFKTLMKIAQTRRAAIPEAIWFEARGIQLKKLALPPSAVEFIDKLGLERIDLTVSFTLRLNREEQRAAIRDLTIEAENLAALKFSLNLGKFYLPPDAEIFAQARNHDWLLAQSQEWRKTEVQSFEFVYRDDSLIPRLDRYLQDSGEPPLKGFVGIVIDAQKTPVSGQVDAGFVSEALQKLWDFTTDPKSIGVVAHPDQPVPIMRLLEDESVTDFQSLGRLLGLQVELNP